jgi:hypothetical protein
MSTDFVVPMCPACGGDRVSLALNRQVYCVDCNRIYPVPESNLGKPDRGVAAGKVSWKVLVRKSA